MQMKSTAIYNRLLIISTHQRAVSSNHGSNCWRNHERTVSHSLICQMNSTNVCSIQLQCKSIFIVVLEPDTNTRNSNCISPSKNTITCRSCKFLPFICTRPSITLKIFICILNKIHKSLYIRHCQNSKGFFLNTIINHTYCVTC